MNLSWAPLAKVQVTHTYHGGACADLGFVLPASTAAALRRARLVARVLPGGLSILAETDAQGAVRAPFQDLPLLFGLRVEAPELSLYTALPVPRPLYSDRNSPGTLAAPEPLLVTGPHFHAPIADTRRPVTVYFRPLTGPPFAQEKVTASQKLDAVAFDLSGFPVGRYVLETRSSAGTLRTQVLLEPELSAAGVFGAVELVLSAAQASAPPTYTLALTALEQRLCYYVVTRNLNPTEFGQLSVTDAGAVEDNRAPVVFERVDVPQFSPAELNPAHLAGAGSGAQVVLFRSTVPLARQARGRRRLQLQRNGDVLVANLPQPPASSSTSDVIVRVSKP